MDNITTTSGLIKAPFTASSYGQASVATIIKGNQMMAAGCKEVGDLMAGTARSHFDRTMAAWQAIAKAPSIKDALAFQIEYVRHSTQAAVAGTSDLIQASNRLAQEAVASITARLNGGSV